MKSHARKSASPPAPSLAKEQDRYNRALVQMSNDGILVFNEDRSIAFINQMATILTGYPPEGLLGKDIRSILGTEVEEILGQLKGPGDKLCQEVQISTARGEQRNISLCLALAYGGKDAVKGCAYLTDITERKRFEERLRISEKKYRELFEQVGEGLYISTPEGKFIDCNQALLDMLGYETKEELLQIDIASDLYVNPGERGVFQEMMERDDSVREWEVEFKRKDGGKIIVLLSAHTIRNSEGKVVGYEGVSIDITQRKQLERELRETNDFMKLLIESSPYAIIATDIKGNIILFNRAAEELLGYKADQVLAQIHITKLYPPGVAKEVMKKLRSPDYGGNGKFTGSEFKIVDKRGKEIPIHLSAAIVYQSGQEVASVGIFTDLRPRLVMEQKLQETHLQLMQLEKLRSLGEMAAGVAHEINNPLGGIIIYASLLQERLPPDDAQRQDLEKIVHEATRCKEIVKTLLEFAHQSGDKKELTDINRAITDGLLFLENQATFHNIEIIKELDPSLPTMVGNAVQLKQVFLNIMINAADVMHGRGVLTIKTFSSEDGNKIVIEFTDTGGGIPEDILPRIFDPFFTTKGVGEGTGLGLSMSYGIVKEHKGNIEVDTVVGKGTTFRVLLPVEYEEAPVQESAGNP
ncbi:MAG: PAS domain S-box protein [Deltaproteobacteria bacterium]|nr:PAS domain S-box protein [Deltaproteobacteria bacterium]